MSTKEQEFLDKLYDFSQDPTKDRSWEAAVKAGKKDKEHNQDQSVILTRELRYASFNVGMMQMLPGTKMLVLPAVLGVTYSAMAFSAWSVGAHMGVEPKDQAEASYDLVALTTLWCQKIQPTEAYRIGVDALRGTLEGESFGKGVIQHLARNGALHVGKKEFGDTGGTLAGATFTETVLGPLVDALWKQFHTDAAADMSDEPVPFVGRFRSVEKARRRVSEFFELAVEYYDAKT